MIDSSLASDFPSDTLVALYCACAIVRHSAAAAFALHRRSTTAPDILACIAPTMQHWFPVPDLVHHQQSHL